MRWRRETLKGFIGKTNEICSKEAKSSSHSSSVWKHIPNTLQINYMQILEGGGMPTPTTTFATNNQIDTITVTKGRDFDRFLKEREKVSTNKK